MNSFSLGSVAKFVNNITLVCLVGVLALFAVTPTHAAPADDFVTTWETTAANETITIPTHISVASYSYTVDWGDGTTDSTVYTDDATHSYTTPGTHTVRISGTFPKIYFGDAGFTDQAKLLTIEQWGTQVWAADQRSAFLDASLLVSNATDTPDFSQVTNMTDMFRGAALFNGDANINSWNVGSVTIFERMFQDATTFDANISNWNTSSSTNLTAMFFGATNFNQPIGGWDTRNVTDINQMFGDAARFNQYIGDWNTSQVTGLNNMFNGADDFDQDISTKPGAALGGTDAWDVSKVTEMSRTFANTDNFNQDISNWDTSSTTIMTAMFSRAIAFDQDLSAWDTGEVTNMNSMFLNTSVDFDAGGWDVRNLLSASGMFTGVTLSTGNYDSLLIGWDSQPLQSGVVFSGGNSEYCAGSTARANMIATDSWVITDGGEDCSAVTPTTAPDLLAASDTGISTTDNVTNSTALQFELFCSAAIGTTTLYSNNPTASTTYSTDICTSVGTTTVTVPVMPVGVHDLVYTQTVGGAESDPSPVLTVLIDTSAPDVPGSLATTSVSTSTVDLSWVVSADNPNPGSDSGVAQYLVYRDSVLVGTVATSSGTTFSETNLTPNTSYSYEVTTVDVAGNVSASSTISVMTLAGADTTAPAAPVAAPDISAATDSGDSTTDNITNDTTPDFTVVCTESGSTITLYSDDSGGNVTLGTGSCTAVGSITITPTIAMVAGSQSVTYTETDAASNESNPSPALVALIDTVAPAVPANLATTSVSESSVDLVWDISTDNVDGSGLSFYTIYRDGVQIATTPALTYADTSVTDGQTYSYTVSATDVAGNESAQSASLSVSVPNSTTPTSSGGGGGSSADLKIRTISAVGTTVTLTGEIHDDNDWEVYYVLSDSDRFPRCTEGLTEYSVAGLHDEDDTFTSSISGLQANTTYYVRLCGNHDQTYKDDSRVTSFITGDVTETPSDDVSTPSAVDSSALDTVDLNISLTTPNTNSAKEITDLQLYLNQFEGANLAVDGTYDADDEAAIRAYQKKYERAILSAWGLSEPTGYVGITTRLHINAKLRAKVAVCPVFTEYNALENKSSRGYLTVNQSVEVMRMQELLLDLGLYAGQLNGIFDKPTDVALRNFQTTFSTVMLEPWNLSQPTGIKYKTTNKFMNYLVGCDVGAIDLEGFGEYNSYGLE